jgi:geranylgeranyl pyrophosphate synthase/predicted secreted hydrolase
VQDYPVDWPGTGAVELSVHDLPHASATLEWWYVNGHLVAHGGGRYAFFAAFFRRVLGYDPVTQAPRYAHSLTWSINDLDAGKSDYVSRVDRAAPKEGMHRIEAGFGSRDPRVDRAIREVLERGNVPKPDRLIEGHVHVEQRRLGLHFGADSFCKNDDGSYQLQLFDPDKRLGCELRIVPQKPPIRHGEDGVVRGSEDESMFYYFIPRCEVTGNLTIQGHEQRVAQGSGWYDHEFGVGTVYDVDTAAEAKLPAAERRRVVEERRARFDASLVGWNWFSLQFDDSTELSIYAEQYVCLNKSAGDHVVTIGPRGERAFYNKVEITELTHWQSAITFVEYATSWRLQIPEAEIDLEVKVAFDDQELVTLIARNSFYEGRVEVRGTKRGRRVTGVGFLERSGIGISEDLDTFFDQVGKLVRRSVERMVPKSPTREQALELIAAPGREYYLDGVDLEQYARTHLHPLREIVDRGGKGWRSYAMNTCIDVVGGDSRDFVQWIAVPELMHVGSLIADDVQDKSTVRRGGPTAHLIYGEAQAITSGTAGYFIGTGHLKHNKLSASAQRAEYELYFDVLRAGHAGQALDLDGFAGVVADTVKSGDSTLLESRVLAVHRLKTGVPAGCLARMGAVAGSGSPEQIAGLGTFFENLGLAFQIIDDVLNLRGFQHDLKTRAEDVTQGKITLPVAKALGRLPLAERQWLERTLASKPSDLPTVTRVVEVLEECQAVEDCAVMARQLIDDSWQRVAGLLEDSLAKVMLRAFGWYVIERHY